MSEDGRTREELEAELLALRGRLEQLEQAEREAERSRAKLHLVEERFRGLFEHSVNGVALHEMVLDDDGVPVDYVFLAINPAFTTLTGLTPEMVLGKRVTEALPGIEHDDFIEIYGKVALTGEPIEFQQYSTPLDRHYDISAYCPQKGQFAVSFRDITAWKKAEEALEAAKETLEERVEERTAELTEANEELARSNDELERFAYIASHDLQEPLRTVSSFLQLLQRRYKGKIDERADTYIGFAVDGADHMRGLINGLLAYSRVSTHAKPATPVALEDALAAASRSLATQIEEVGAEVDHDPLPTVLADPTQVTQLLQNLLSNALRFRSESPPRIHVSARIDCGRWNVSVRDNGIGIDEEYLERVFGVFQRLHTREEYPGTGIGLSICRRIVERHGGAIQARSMQGEGTTFSFTLPMVDDPESIEEP